MTRLQKYVFNGAMVAGLYMMWRGIKGEFGTTWAQMVIGVLLFFGTAWLLLRPGPPVDPES